MKTFFARTYNFDAGGNGGQQQQQGSQSQGGGGGSQGNQGGQGNEQASGVLAQLEAAAAAAGGEQQQQQGQQQREGQAEIYKPNGLPDSYLGKTNQETIDKLLAEVSGRPKPPAKAAEYAFDAPKEFADKFGSLKDDPVLPIWQEVAHEIGLSNDQFANAIPKLYDRLHKAGLIDEPMDADAIAQKLAPDEKDPVQRYRKAADRMRGVESFVKGLETRKVVTPAEARVLHTMWATPEATMAFEKILKLIPAEHGVQGGGGHASNMTVHEQQMRALYPTQFRQQSS